MNRQTQELWFYKQTNILACSRTCFYADRSIILIDPPNNYACEKLILLTYLVYQVQYGHISDLCLDQFTSYHIRLVESLLVIIGDRNIVISRGGHQQGSRLAAPDTKYFIVMCPLGAGVGHQAVFTRHRAVGSLGSGSDATTHTAIGGAGDLFGDAGVMRAGGAAIVRVGTSGSGQPVTCPVHDDTDTVHVIIVTVTLGVSILVTSILTLSILSNIPARKEIIQ